MTPAESFAGFAEAVHARVPDDHSIDLRDAQDTFRRATCGDCGRVVPTRQNLCPRCGGSVHDVVEIDRMREVALHFGCQLPGCSAYGEVREHVGVAGQL